MRKQHGFTLIELLVVISIIGVIAVVVVLNVGQFIGRGKIEAANVEMHQVLTAVTAYMAEDGESSFAATIGPESNYPTDAPSSEGVHQYITNPGGLQADYEILNGAVTTATPIEGSRWGTLSFCGQWQESCPEGG